MSVCMKVNNSEKYVNLKEKYSLNDNQLFLFYFKDAANDIS